MAQGPKIFRVTNSSHGRDGLLAFESFYRTEAMVDVTLLCRSERDTDDADLDIRPLKAHRVILSAYSAYFRRIFSSPLLYDQVNGHSHPLVILKDVSLSNMRSILEFIYSGEVHVAKCDIDSFMVCAKDLEIEGLADVGVETINSHLQARKSVRGERQPELATESQDGVAIDAVTEDVLDLSRDAADAKTSSGSPSSPSVSSSPTNACPVTRCPVQPVTLNRYFLRDKTAPRQSQAAATSFSSKTIREAIISNIRSKSRGSTRVNDHSATATATLSSRDDFEDINGSIGANVFGNSLSHGTNGHQRAESKVTSDLSINENETQSIICEPSVEMVLYNAMDSDSVASTSFHQMEDVAKSSSLPETSLVSGIRCNGSSLIASRRTRRRLGRKGSDAELNPRRRTRTPCPLCIKVFASPEGMKLHMKSVHFEERYPCTVCGKVFKWRNHLSAHMSTKHKPDTDAIGQQEDQGELQDEQNEDDQMVAMERIMFNQDIKLEKVDDPSANDETMPFQGDIVDPRSGRANVRWSNFKPTPCPVCKKVFTTQYGMNLHMKSVHLSMTYPCHLCGEIFKWQTHRSTHMNTVHKKNIRRRSQV